MDSDLYKNTYRVSSSRAQCWNYASPAIYFVTVCTKDMQSWFGKIRGGEMLYSKIGEVAKETWETLPEQFNFVTAKNFVIMPNHVHGIITIKPPHPLRRDAINRVSTNGGVTGKHNPMGKQTLGQIVRWFKGRTTFFARKHNLTFQWQPRFYDVIIVDDKKFERIRQSLKIASFLGLFSHTSHLEFRRIINCKPECDEYIQDYIESNPYQWKYDPYFCG